jgi:hypothetical protein
VLGSSSHSASSAIPDGNVGCAGLPSTGKHEVLAETVSLHRGKRIGCPWLPCSWAEMHVAFWTS